MAKCGHNKGGDDGVKHISNDDTARGSECLPSFEKWSRYMLELTAMHFCISYKLLILGDALIIEVHEKKV